MKVNATLVLGCFVLLSINGCAEKQVQFSKCVTPDVQEPILNNTYQKSITSASKQCLTNYLKMKDYSDKLLASNMLCK